MSFTTNKQHDNTRDFYTATHSTMATHTFFCTAPNCDNKTLLPYTECDYCAKYWADVVEEDTWCGTTDWLTSTCTCGGGSRMCPHCCEEDSDPCRGCGSHSLWDNRYCRTCYEVRYGPCYPMCIDCGGHELAQDSARCHSCIDGARSDAAAAVPPARSPDELREVIAEIEERLTTNMTKGQRDDWIWILQNRRADLAAAEKEMCEGYDQDDLNKLDRANHY